MTGKSLLKIRDAFVGTGQLQIGLKMDPLNSTTRRLTWVNGIVQGEGTMGELQANLEAHGFQTRVDIRKLHWGIIWGNNRNDPREKGLDFTHQGGQVRTVVCEFTGSADEAKGKSLVLRSPIADIASCKPPVPELKGL